jgi:hypothetical protein
LPLSKNNIDSICFGDELLVNLTKDSTSFFWENGSTSAIRTFNESGKYWVKTEGRCGTYSDTLDLLKLLELSINLGDDTAICRLDNLQLYIDDDKSDVLWNDGDSNHLKYLDTPGLYWVEIKNNCGTAKDSIHVFELPLPLINIGNDSVICESKPIELSVDGLFTEVYGVMVQLSISKT